MLSCPAWTIIQAILKLLSQKLILFFDYKIDTGYYMNLYERKKSRKYKGIEKKLTKEENNVNIMGIHLYEI